MNLIVNLKVPQMQNLNSSVKDLELLQILAVLMQRFKKQTRRHLCLKKIRKLNPVQNLNQNQMIVIHQSLQLKKLQQKLLQNNKLQLKKLPLKSNHLQKNLMMTLKIQMKVNQTVPKMLKRSQKLKLNPQQRPLQKKLNHLQNPMILMILTQMKMTMKNKVKQVKNQQRNNKM